MASLLPARPLAGLLPVNPFPAEKNRGWEEQSLEEKLRLEKTPGLLDEV